MTGNNNILVKIKEDIIERIKGRDDIKPLLSIALKRSRATINRMLNENQPNGPLTKEASVSVIIQCLNTTRESILTVA